MFWACKDNSQVVASKKAMWLIMIDMIDMQMADIKLILHKCKCICTGSVCTKARGLVRLQVPEKHMNGRYIDIEI